jgi:16S rRNA (cytosine1402-N4)-methyltransferase
MVERLLPDGKLIGIDQDDEALKAAGERLKDFGKNVILAKGNFSDLARIVSESGYSSVDGVLFDLGVSSHQLDAGERGFSFRADAPLDMRMDATAGRTAADLVNTLSERDLSDIIWKYGEERWSKRIAKFIVERRQRSRILTTGDLVDVILAAVPAGARSDRIHPATRTFQGLRIAVNRELESLQSGLEAAVSLLSVGGRVCILSYHSLEDRIVKDTLLKYTGRCTCPASLPICVCGAKRSLKILTKKPVTASDDEIERNPRSRSAKLRTAEKL